MIVVRLISLLLVFCSMYASASIFVESSRIIYPQNETDITVKLMNRGRTAALTQHWIDADESTLAAKTSNVPFLMTPPISRIEGGKSQVLRIVYTQEALPTDRESLFYLNILEVPARDKNHLDASDAAEVQMALRVRLKLFFRPEHMGVTIDEVPNKINFEFVDHINGEMTIRAINPTPYYVSFTGLTAESGSVIATQNEGGMLAPMETSTFKLQLVNGLSLPANMQLSCYYITDFGGVLPITKSLSTITAR